MPYIVTTARGESVDVDVIRIKSDLSQAPMTIDIQARKRLLDKEKVKQAIIPITATPEVEQALHDLKVISGVPEEAVIDDGDGVKVSKKNK